MTSVDTVGGGLPGDVLRGGGLPGGGLPGGSVPGGAASWASEKSLPDNINSFYSAAR